MPQIIVATDGGGAFGEGAVTLWERVNIEDFQSQHFAAQLVERLGWAVEDAVEIQHHDDGADHASVPHQVERARDEQFDWEDTALDPVPADAREQRVTAQWPA